MLQIIANIALSLTVIGVILVIIMDKGLPRAKLAWIIIITLLPVLGLILYVLLGISPRHHWMFERRRRRYKQLLDSESTPEWEALLFGDSSLASIKEEYRPLASLMSSGTHLAPTEGNSFEIITSGARKYELLMRDIEAAKESIHLEYFHFGNDKGSRAVRDILVRKARDGVKVRFLNENIANFPISPSYYKAMRRDGVEVLNFTDPRQHALDFATRINYRNHRKIVVIDGRIGYTGGMNINDHYFEQWRDTHLRITGPAVASLQYLFLDSWVTAGGILDRPMTELYPMLKSPVAEVPEGPKSLGGKTMQIMADEPSGSNPVFQLGYEWVLHNVRRYIYINTPYFVPPEPVMNALKAAAMTGVDVRLMLPAKNDTIFLDKANRSFYIEALEAGVRIYERGREFIHSKVFVADDYISCIGSSNIDNRSFNFSYEVNALVYDRQTAELNKRIFEEELALCREITLAEVDSWSWIKRFWQQVVKLLAPIL